MCVCVREREIERRNQEYNISSVSRFEKYLDERGKEEKEFSPERQACEDDEEKEKKTRTDNKDRHATNRVERQVVV